jgi:hypothetical protein
MKAFPFIVVVVAGALSACTSYQVEHDWDVEAPFGDYHTYAWMERAPTPDRASQDATDARLHSDLLDRRIRGAVDESMKQKGMAVAAEPDLRVVYHVQLEDKIDVTDWDYEYSGSYWGWGDRDIGVYTREEGTLLVDLTFGDRKRPFFLRDYCGSGPANHFYFARSRRYR